MAVTILRKHFSLDGAWSDPSSVVLSDATGTYGVRRKDTQAVVVAAGTPMVRVGDGLYRYYWSDPAAGLTYEYAVTYVIDGETYRETGEVIGGGLGLLPLTDLDPMVRTWIGGASDALLHQQVRFAFRRLCERTRIYEWVGDITLEEDVSEYALSIPAGTGLLSIESVTYLDDDGLVEYGAVPIYHPERGDCSVKLVHTPSASGDPIRVRACVLPDRTCADAPDWLMQRYGDTIASGAIMMLAGMQGRPWFNMAAYKMHEALWRRGLGEGVVGKVHGRVDGGGRIAIPKCC